MKQTTTEPKIKIVLLGRKGVGKSSFLSLILGQNAQNVSKPSLLLAGVGEISQQMHPFGTVLWYDTPGLCEENITSGLSSLASVLQQSDVAVLVCEGDKIGAVERDIITHLELKRIPRIVVFNKADTHHIGNPEGAISVNSLDKTQRLKVLAELKAALIRVSPEDLVVPPVLLGDLVPDSGSVVMLVPNDYEVAKGRISLPHAQVIRDCLDHDQMILTVKEKQYTKALESLTHRPDLIVCDSQLVEQMVVQTPNNVKCTSFSVLTARTLGDLQQMTDGALAIWQLKDGDRVLIAEPILPENLKDDTGTVKIPRWLSERTGKDLIIEHIYGSSCPLGLNEYNLVIHRGLHQHSRKDFLEEQSRCAAANVPLTNYSVCLSELNGVLSRILEPFPNTLERYKRKREEIIYKTSV